MFSWVLQLRLHYLFRGSWRLGLVEEHFSGIANLRLVLEFVFQGIYVINTLHIFRTFHNVLVQRSPYDWNIFHLLSFKFRPFSTVAPFLVHLTTLRDCPFLLYKIFHHIPCSIFPIQFFVQTHIFYIPRGQNYVFYSQQRAFHWFIVPVRNRRIGSLSSSCLVSSLARSSALNWFQWLVPASARMIRMFVCQKQSIIVGLCCVDVVIFLLSWYDGPTKIVSQSNIYTVIFTLLIKDSTIVNLIWTFFKDEVDSTAFRNCE